LDSPHRHSRGTAISFASRLLEFLRRLLHRLAFVGGFDFANPCLLGGELVIVHLVGGSGSGLRATSFIFRRQLGQQVRPVASDDAADFRVDLGNVVETWRIISSSSALSGRPCRNSTDIRLLHLAAGGSACSR